MLFEINLFTTFVLSHLLIGGFLIVALATAVRVLHLSSELQSWLWATTLAICVLIPFLSLAPDEVPVTVVDEEARSLQVKTPTAVSDGVPDTTPAPAVSSAEETYQWRLPGRWVKDAIAAIYILLGIWLLGGAWRAASLLHSIRRTRQLVKTAAPYPGIPLREGGLSTVTCPLLISESVDAPMAAGAINPVILLPKVFVEKFDSEQLVPIILHEWAHIRRWDLWIGVLEEFIAIVFWWSPVMRVINRRLHLSRELACDIRAAQTLESGKRLAQSLLDCAELMLTRKQNVLAMGLFRKKKDLRERINAVLKYRNEKTPRLLAIGTACFVLAITSLAVAQEYGPRINLASVTGQAEYASGLSRIEGERLIEVIRRGDIRSLTEMMNSGMDINTPVLGEGTALIEAVRQNNREIVQLLIRSGANVNQPALGDGNPMIAAARHNRIELAEMLHQRDADLDAVVPRDGTPLIAAIRSGHDAMALQLIDWGADVNQAAKWDGNPLIMAAMTDNLEIAKKLREMGANVNGVVSTDETPLINAAHHGHFDMVKFLVESGADVNLGVMADDGEFRTPLNRARNKEIRDYLIAMGAAE